MVIVFSSSRLGPIPDVSSTIASRLSTSSLPWSSNAITSMLSALILTGSLPTSHDEWAGETRVGPAQAGRRQHGIGTRLMKPSPQTTISSPVRPLGNQAMAEGMAW